MWTSTPSIPQPDMLTGQFWELKSTCLIIANAEKYYIELQGAVTLTWTHRSYTQSFLEAACAVSEYYWLQRWCGRALWGSYTRFHWSPLQKGGVLLHAQWLPLHSPTAKGKKKECLEGIRNWEAHYQALWYDAHNTSKSAILNLYSLVAWPSTRRGECEWQTHAHEHSSMQMELRTQAVGGCLCSHVKLHLHERKHPPLLRVEIHTRACPFLSQSSFEQAVAWGLGTPALNELLRPNVFFNEPHIS